MTRVKTLVLFLILEEMFQFFTIENNVCCRLITHGLYYVEVGSFYAHFFLSMLDGTTDSMEISLLKLMSTESVMPSNHLILCHPLLLPSIFLSSGSFLINWLLHLVAKVLELQL